ncbi:MAG: hypothetical protein LT067_06395 [Sulfurovum sp.]|nr:hypothetical protein [Sulfurovum sp.]
MGYRQYRLFDYTRSSELLTGDDVVKADKIKQKIKALQTQKILVENWKLDIFCRDTDVVDGVTLMKIDPGGATAPHEKYAIAVVIKPLSIHGYEIPIAFFEHRKDAEALLDTVRVYLAYRYGV